MTGPSLFAELLGDEPALAERRAFVVIVDGLPAGGAVTADEAVEDFRRYVHAGDYAEIHDAERWNAR